MYPGERMWSKTIYTLFNQEITLRSRSHLQVRPENQMKYQTKIQSNENKKDLKIKTSRQQYRPIGPLVLVHPILDYSVNYSREMGQNI